MKISNTYRIVAFILAFLMFFSSVGFSIDFHYCKGDLKSFSLIGVAAVCHQAKKGCPRHAKMQAKDNIEDSSCCSNETIVVSDLDIDFTIIQGLELTELQLNLILAFGFSQIDYSSPVVNKSTFLKNLEPLPSRNIYALLERFLI